jgi:hypothetical protein
MTLLLAMLISLGLSQLPDPPTPHRIFSGRPSESRTMPRIKCLVVGNVVWAKEEIEPHVRLKSSCPIQIQRDGQYLKLSSSKWIVEVVIPETASAKPFLYIWGQRAATIGNDTVTVNYGPVDGT